MTDSVVENEAMVVSNEAAEVLGETSIPEKSENFGVQLLKSAATMAALGGGLALGFRVVDGLYTWGEKKIRISKAKKEAAKAEKEKIKAEEEAKKEAEKSENSEDADKVLKQTEQ